ncbi:MAG TPA: PilW family protein [Gallionella sp.]|nr:PilW family protein [Gallionella sp.]
MLTYAMTKSTNTTSKYILPGRQRGLSLIELMISITVGLLLLAGITTLIVQQSSARSELEKSSRQIENGRYAMDILRNDIEHAGFYSEYSPPLGSIYQRPNPCTEVDAGWDNGSFDNPDVPVPIYGYPNATDPVPTCLPNYKSGTAVLVIRRTATEPGYAAPNDFEVSQCPTDTKPFEIVSAVGGVGTLHQKDCTASPPGTLAIRRAYIERIYYISTCDVVDAGNACLDSIPTLKMKENGGSPVPLVEGIENMQLDYGIDTNGDGSPDSYTASPLAANWPDVMAVRVSLLARNNEPTAGYQDNKSYTLGSITIQSGSGIPATDVAYKRHVFSEVVRAINPSGRRAS